MPMPRKTLLIEIKSASSCSLEIAEWYPDRCVHTRDSVGVCVCVSCLHSPVAISPEILSILLYLEHSAACGCFKPLAGSCVVVWNPTRKKKNLCSNRDPLKRQTFPNLQAQSCEFMSACACVLAHVTFVIDGSLVIPQGDHRQLNSILSPCRLFLPSFTFKGQNP